MCDGVDDAGRENDKFSVKEKHSTDARKLAASRALVAPTFAIEANEAADSLQLASTSMTLQKLHSPVPQHSINRITDVVESPKQKKDNTESAKQKMEDTDESRKEMGEKRRNLITKMRSPLSPVIGAIIGASIFILFQPKQPSSIIHDITLWFLPWIATLWLISLLVESPEKYESRGLFLPALTCELLMYVSVPVFASMTVCAANEGTFFCAASVVVILCIMLGLVWFFIIHKELIFGAGCNHKKPATLETMKAAGFQAMVAGSRCVS